MSEILFYLLIEWMRKWIPRRVPHHLTHADEYQEQVSERKQLPRLTEGLANMSVAREYFSGTEMPESRSLVLRTE